MVKTYAVIGDPINHSLSPTIHNAVFRDKDMDCTYIAYRIPRDELVEGINSLKKINISGFNVTIPHKIQMVKYLDVMDENCTITGACNTVLNKDGTLKGYNTDVAGFMEPIYRRNISVKGMSILLLGAGGAARAVVVGLKKESVGKICIANRTEQRAKELADFASKFGVETEIRTLNNVSGIGFDMIINSTSLGLADEVIPISNDTIQSSSIIYDLVYKPINTDFIKKAKESKAKIIYGYEMLLGQATRAFEIWHGIKAPYDIMKRSILGVQP
ncbi:MAG: shikimate dehydrogenase [Candidatus Nitrosoabyssus spongiisocia]|nr:MAG: shikimate dehydrogenase [Nitrosopumilaceae archaeon AB1(1)]